MLIRARDSNLNTVLYSCSSNQSKAIASTVSQSFPQLPTLFLARHAPFKNQSNPNVRQPSRNRCTLTFLACRFINPKAKSIQFQPSLPEAYRLKKAERILKERFFVSGLNREIEIVEALPIDETIVRNYVRNEFAQQHPMAKTFRGF